MENVQGALNIDMRVASRESQNSKTKMKNDGVKFKIIGKKRYLTPFGVGRIW